MKKPLVVNFVVSLIRAVRHNPCHMIADVKPRNQ